MCKQCVKIFTVFILLIDLTDALAVVNRQDPPDSQHYDFKIITKSGGGFKANQAAAVVNQTNGPAGEAEDNDLIKGFCMDLSGNGYWAGSPYPVIRRYDATKNWVSTVAGSTSGYLDGPLERARFNGWSYNATNLICVSEDGQDMFIRDVGNGVWRYIDFEQGMVSTVGSATSGGYLVIARDCSTGDICAFRSDGTDAPDCKGYRKIPSAKWKTKGWYAFDGIALDAANMKFYFHCRYATLSIDLLTGDSAKLTSDLWCPTGMSISSSGRYLYIGGGDDMFCWRKDLNATWLYGLGRSKIANTGDGVDVAFRMRNADFINPISTSSAWPSACVFSADGTMGYWPTCWGIYLMVPRQ